MKEFIIFSLSILIFIRLIGFGISIEFYLKSKEIRFRNFIFGWFFWILTSLFAMLANEFPNHSLNDSFYLVNGIFGSFAIFLLAIGFISYFIVIKPIYFRFMTIILLIIPLLLELFVNHDLAITTTSIFQNSITLGLLVIGIFKRNRIKNTLDNSIYWFYLMVLTAVLSLGFIMVGGLKTVYTDNASLDDIMTIYFFAVIASILVVFLIIHFERGIMNSNKTHLKDIYSHEIGNIMQIIMGTASILKMKEESQNERQTKIDTIIEKCDESSQILKNIRKL